MKHLLLIGFMASGKTTLAKALSISLNLPIFSTDFWIENQAQQSIKGIFALYGESEFRAWERRAFEEIRRLKDVHIIDCGGGFVLGNDVKKLGRVYYLDTPIEEIERRLSQEDQRANRPLAKDMHILYSQREKIYHSKASKIVRAKDQEEVLKEVVEDWKKNS